MLTTGSPLLPEQFDYIYRDIKTDLHLASISGGSDIISCFVCGNPNLPVRRGELQCAGLGMDVQIYNESGAAIIGAKGELVCASPFPSRPLFFWNDPNHTQYKKAYFSVFDGIWHHGDYAEQTDSGGFIIYGRSDATLNPSGIRIGTAELYQQLESFHEIADALAVGQHWQSSERIVLFVVMKKHQALTQELQQQIKTVLRDQASPHHVPAVIYAVPELPKTHNGKIAELAVKKIIHHQPIDNTHALANPDCLDAFRVFATRHPQP